MPRARRSAPSALDSDAGGLRTMLTALLLAAAQLPSPDAGGRPTIEITPRSGAVRAGDTLRLRAHVIRGSASDTVVLWTAIGEGTVDQNGLVRTGYAGYVRVRATASGATGSAIVIVHP